VFDEYFGMVNDQVDALIFRPNMTLLGSAAWGRDKVLL
jgi:hypothetical protein